MAKKSNLLVETLMYSVHSETGEVVTHHMPWPRESPALDRYMAKGFTFERPAPEIITITETQALVDKSDPVLVVKRKYRKRKVK